MNTQLNSDLYESCERAFLVEVAKTVGIIVERTGLLNKQEKKELASSLTFAIAAHLSGSSFGGRIAGDEIYPKLGFYKGEADDALYFGKGCKLHELVPSVLDELSAKDK